MVISSNAYLNRFVCDSSCIMRFHIQETRIIPVLLYAIDFPAVYQAAEEIYSTIFFRVVFFFQPFNGVKCTAVELLDLFMFMQRMTNLSNITSMISIRK